ncbi:MAG: NAD(P)H-hydrate dehydratase [Firmicutes bacterium]|nr:NAD(P)H-hydrate dehydratase [Bacillota bacterium]
MTEKLVTDAIIKNILGGSRNADSDKRDYGELLIFAGKDGMAGAAIMTALAALRSGTGLVKVVTPKTNYPSLQQALPEAICVSEDDVLENIRHCTAIVIGPGMGASTHTANIIKFVIEELVNLGRSVPVLIDADGLNTIAESEELKKMILMRNQGIGKAKSDMEIVGSAVKGKIDIVITPHNREAGRLLGCAPIESENREKACVALAEIMDCTALLKGAGTLVYKNGSDIIWKNTTGNPGMATAGSGDVLSGVIGGLMAQGVGAENAAISGAYIHGLAGDVVAESIGERSVIASDILVTLPAVFKRL